MAFFDPLKVRTIQSNAGIFINDQMLPYHRIMAFHCLSFASFNDESLLEAELNRLNPRFSNSREFFQAYREYMNK